MRDSSTGGLASGSLPTLSWATPRRGTSPQCAPNRRCDGRTTLDQIHDRAVGIADHGNTDFGLAIRVGHDGKAASVPETVLTPPVAIEVRPTPAQRKSESEHEVGTGHLVDAAGLLLCVLLKSGRAISDQRGIKRRQRASRRVHARARNERAAGGDAVVGRFEAQRQVAAVQQVLRTAEPVGLGGLTRRQPLERGVELPLAEVRHCFSGHLLEYLAQDPTKCHRLVGKGPAPKSRWFLAQSRNDISPVAPQLGVRAEVRQGHSGAMSEHVEQCDLRRAELGHVTAHGRIELELAAHLEQRHAAREHCLRSRHHLKTGLGRNRDGLPFPLAQSRRNAGSDVEQPLAAALHDQLTAGESPARALPEKELLDLLHRGWLSPLRNSASSLSVYGGGRSWPGPYNRLSVISRKSARACKRDSRANKPSAMRFAKIRSLLTLDRNNPRLSVPRAFKSRRMNCVSKRNGPSRSRNS